MEHSHREMYADDTNITVSGKQPKIYKLTKGGRIPKPGIALELALINIFFHSDDYTHKYKLFH